MRIFSSTEPEDDDMIFITLLIFLHTILSQHRSHRTTVWSYHIFHPRDLHFLSSSLNLLKNCFSRSRNALFIWVRACGESCRNQNRVSLTVWPIRSGSAILISKLFGRKPFHRTGSGCRSATSVSPCLQGAINGRSCRRKKRDTGTVAPGTPDMIPAYPVPELQTNLDCSGIKKRDRVNR